VSFRAAAVVALYALLVCPVRAEKEPGAVPVITRAAGSVTLNSAQGDAHELVSTEPLNAPSMVVTSRTGWAMIDLAGAGHVRIGPSAAMTVTPTNGRLYVLPRQGAACVQGDPEEVVVRVSGFDVTPSRAPAVFEIVANTERTEAAVVNGTVALSAGSTWRAVNVGQAIVIAKTGAMHGAPMPNLAVKWRGWHCPD
jgi:hypothetical protein